MAARWGRETARKIASAIGASELAAQSNQCALAGRPVVIKCAAPKTDSVGVTYLMLDRITDVIGAFQLDGLTFDVWSLPVETFKKSMRPTASRGASAGKVGLVSRSVFYARGKHVQKVRV